MYIPSTFFSTQGSCITATTTSITGSGGVSTGSFVSGGVYWDYWKFENTADVKSGVSSSFSASFNVLSGSSAQAHILVVGGGGGGGFNPGDDCINPYIDTLGSAGGGGGGGVVYYNNFLISSGSYEIVVGAGGKGGDATANGRIGDNGSVSYLKNKSFEYTPFTSSFITAYGGGGGAGNTDNCIGAGYGLGNSGASAGGGSQTAIASNFVPPVNSYGYTGGVPPVIQGYGAGSMTGNPYANDRAMGGGGALTSSANITDTYNPFAGSPGGDGLFYNLTGTALGYGAGGGGVRWTNTGTGVLTGNGAGWGNAGSGGTGGFGGRFSTPRGSEPGLNGIVIISIPRCSSAFSCKTFNITGSTGTLSYLPCNLPYVTQSVLSSPTDYFSACLLTFSGSNTPVLLEGETTASVGGECGNQLTQSFNCNCTFVQAIAGSGTQTLTYFPCNGTGSVTNSITTAGKNICIENLSNVSLTGIGSTINYYGACKTGSVCTGVQYTSSIVNCSSILATAGGSGGTLTYLPCGASASVALTLSGSESMSICAAFTSSFLSLSGIGSTFQTLGVCYSGSANPTSASVDYLIVGGGAGGGTPYGGGGGAGALFSGSTIITFYPTSSVVYPVVVGNGGAPNQNGFSSSLFLTSSFGGGTGGSNSNGGASGGNGGGGGGFNGPSSTGSVGGLGTQGFNGGTGAINAFGNGYAAGGGAGASQNGFNGNELNSAAANGGSGSAWLNGTFYAGGGGGGFDGYGGGSPNRGGRGGGGRGAYNNTYAALAATGSTGSGGGGGQVTTSGAGSDGVVYVRFKV